MLKQPYLSNVIKSLEAQLGTQLLERSSKGVYLTEDGKFLYDKIRLIVNATHELQQSYNYPSNKRYQNEQASISVYVLPQVNSEGSLVKCSRQFRETFPSAQLMVYTRENLEIVQTVFDSPNAFGIIASTRQIDDLFSSLPDRLEMKVLRTIDLVAVTSPINAEAQQYTSISCAELVKKNLIVFCSEGTPEHSLAYQVLENFGEPNIQYAVDNYAVYFDFLLHSSCYSLMERSMAESKGYTIIPLSDKFHYHTLLLYQKSSLDNFVMKSFYDMLLFDNSYR